MHNPFQKPATQKQKMRRRLGTLGVALVLSAGWAVFFAIAIINEVEKLTGPSVAWKLLGFVVLLLLVCGTIFVYGWLGASVIRGLDDD